MTNDPSSRPMPAEAVVRALYDRVAAADFAAVLELLDEDVEFVQAAGLPFGGRYVGKQAFGDMAARIFATWPGFSVRPLSFLTDGAELVTVVTELTGDALQMPMVECGPSVPASSCVASPSISTRPTR